MIYELILIDKLILIYEMIDKLILSYEMIDKLINNDDYEITITIINNNNNNNKSINHNK